MDFALKTKTCSFSGHRRISKDKQSWLRVRIAQEIQRLAEKGVFCFVCGGALGFDTLAAQTVLELRQSNADLHLLLILPCRDQTHGWSARDIAVYQSILEQADQVCYTEERYSAGCMHKRNRALVDCSNWCVCYLKNTRGGTRYTVDYAVQRGLTVVNLAEDEDDSFAGGC